MFKGHQFQNLKNSVKTKESMSQRLGIKRDWERYHVQSFCLMYGETEAREGPEPRWATWHRQVVSSTLQPGGGSGPVGAYTPPYKLG